MPFALVSCNSMESVSVNTTLPRHPQHRVFKSPPHVGHHACLALRRIFFRGFALWGIRRCTGRLTSRCTGEISLFARGAGGADRRWPLVSLAVSVQSYHRNDMEKRIHRNGKSKTKPISATALVLLRRYSCARASPEAVSAGDAL